MTIETQHLDMVQRLTKDPVQILKELDWERVHCWHMITGMTTEVIELIREYYEFATPAGPHEFDMENFIKELGDYEFYLAGLLNWCGWENVPCTSPFQAVCVSVPGVTTELLLATGEFLDQVKAHVIYNKGIDEAKFRASVGKIQVALQQLRCWTGFSREEVLKVNMEKLSKRQPTGTYVDEHAIARKDENACT